MANPTSALAANFEKFENLKIWKIGAKKIWMKEPTLTDDEDADEPDDTKLHVVVVEEDVGQVSGQQGVDSAGSTDQVNIRVKHWRAQWT